MAKKPESESSTALLDAPTTAAEQKPALPQPSTTAPTMREARERFINRCLHDWGREQFLADRGCDPAPGHVDKLVEKAGRMFDRLFEKRPVTNNL